jgi:hypothetical protein
VRHRGAEPGGVVLPVRAVHPDGPLGDGDSYYVAYRWSTVEMAALLIGVVALTFLIPRRATEG